MPIPYKHKRSTEAGVAPTTLQDGEIAINVAAADPKIFYKDSASTIRAFSLASYASATHSHVVADISNFTSVANVVSVNAKTGVVSISHTDVTAASASHTHAASDVTSGTFDAARLPLATTLAVGGVIVGTGLGVSSGTVSVTYGTSSGTACEGNDARLSDTRTPTDGSVTTAKLANDAVTYAKLQNVSATDRILGRSSAGSGDVEEITCTSFGRSLIDDADAAAARTTLSVQPTASPAFTGRVGIGAAANAIAYVHIDQTAPSSGGVTQVIRNTVTIPSTSSDYWTFLSAPTTQAASFTLSAMRHFVVDPQAFGAGSTVTNQFGYIVESTMTNATNNYGFYSNIASGTGRWNFYSNGTAPSFFGGQLLVTAGSGSSGSYKPGVAVSGDDDSGLMQAGGANTISLVTNGTERMRIDASGNVGIGSTANLTAVLNFPAADSGEVINYYPSATESVRSGVGKYSAEVRHYVPADDVFTWRTGGPTGTERMKLSASLLTVGNSVSITASQVYSDIVGATNRDLFIDNSGKLGYVSSIRASKTDIESIDDVSWLRDLTPVSFRYRRRNEDGTYSDEPDGTRDYGLIAEDVEPVAPEMCFYDMVDGEPQLRGVHYSKLITPMLRYIQQLEARIAALEERINA